MANPGNFTCPLGGNWYTCSTGSKFVGCCVTNPCATGCAQGNIRQAAFNKTLYGTFPDASCDAASNFYTCTAGKSFWGCCKSVPCTTEPTCPPGDLVPAFLGRPEQASFYDPDKVSTSISVYISTSASTSAYQSSTAGPVSSNNGSKGMNSSAVIGGAVGGVGVLAIVIGILVFILCRRRKQKRAQEATPQMSNIPAPIAPEKGFSYTEHPDPKTPLPAYSATHFTPISYQNPAGHTHSPQHVQQQWAYNAAEPQELPDSSPNTNRYSELSATPISPR